VFSLDLPLSLSFAAPDSGIPKSTTVRSYLSPEHIRASAWLYGVDVAKTQHARILDLGCGDASHLLPFVFSRPQAQIIGVDLSPEKIEQGKEHYAAAEMTNIQLFCTDLETLIEGLEGEFDYILIHGIFSYIDSQTREALLSFCRQHLAPNGIIAMEWLTQPGSGLNQVIQDAIAFHTRDAQSEDVRLASARAALTWLSLGMSQHPAKEALQRLVAAAEAMDDELFSLRYLHNMNNASYLVDFHENVLQAELRYVGDIKPWIECPEHYAGQVAELSNTINPEQDKLLLQQYLDFSVHREKRFSLLTSAVNEAEIHTLPEMTRLRDLHWAGSYRREIGSDGTIYNRLQNGAGDFIATDEIVTLAILDVLGEAWPLSMSFDQIAFNTRAPDEAPELHASKVMKSLQALFLQGSTGLHFQREASIYNSATQTELSGIYGQAIHGLKEGFNFWYEAIELTLQEQVILEKNSLAFADPKLVDTLIRKGVLTSNATGWRKHYQSVITQAALKGMPAAVLPLMLFSATLKQGGFNDIESHSAAFSYRQPKNNLKPVPQKQIDAIHLLIHKGEYDRARSIACELAENMPDNPNAWLELSRVYSRTNKHANAVGAINQTLGLTSLNWDIYYELVIALWYLNQNWLAGRLTKAILRVQPQHALAWDTLGRLYSDFNSFTAAEYCYQKALNIMPKNSGMISNLAVLLADQARMDEAVELLRKAIKIKPDELNYYSSLNFGLAHIVDITPDALYQEHRAYGRMVEKWAKENAMALPYSTDQDPARRLRIGFVSGDLCRHPVAWFLKPFWANLNRERNELFIYHTSPLSDDVTEYFRESANQWRDVANESPVELARTINNDAIDILIDLSGHTGYNRLSTFALKPAPLSISWIGYPGTTGLTAIDYRICGTWMAAPGELDAQFSEKIIYMPMPVQYEPPSNAPEINTLPALGSSVFTFGSLNRPKKINDSVIALWSKILTSTSNARMIIGYMPCDEVSDRLRAKFEAHGVKPEQLDFRPKTDFARYMSLHREIDLLLDTFPYNGGTTSNNAIWMGVPTLTISGQTMAGRHGNEILKAFRQEQFLVENEQEYYEQAVSWMHKREELNAIRLSMRNNFSEIKNQGGDPSIALENALRTIWKHYCAGKSPVSFTVEI
jgi:predicted O-linked N-acetylglucosamine transferase (SPINDLY family)/2-polyprenyl-3-methyl-5-hydroxy-6-metoxy-1,4-benzoquinol methylase